MLLFIASDPRELAGLLRHCRGVRPLAWPVDWAREGQLHGRKVQLAANGVGPQRAAAALRDAEMIVSVGYCGALEPSLRVGDIVVATSVGGIPARQPRCELPYHSGPVASQSRVASSAEQKRKLRSAGAIAVEMEAAGVAAEAARRGLPFACIRAVTDRAEETFRNDFDAALRPDGHFDTMLLLRSALQNPASALPELVRLHFRCRRAARNLGEFLAHCRF